MKDLKKYMAPMLIGAIAMATPVASHAFTSVSVVSSTASVTVTGGATSMAVSIKNVADNLAATAISWTAAAGQGWTRANQYVQLDTVLSVAGSGIQTYTDNTAADASPKYTGVINATNPTPAGLVNAAITTQKLPTAWAISDTTSTVTPAADPNNTADPNSFAWFFHEDKAQVAVPSQGAGAFANGDPYITAIQSGNAIHFAQAPTSFGPAASPNFVNLEANFASAMGGTTYKTSALRFELFTQ